MKSFHLVACTALAAVLLLAANAMAATKKPASQSGGNLGSSLLDGLLDGELGESLKEGPDRKNSQPRRVTPQSPLVPDQDLLQRMMREDVGPPGEDVGQKNHPLSPVVEGMRRAERLLQGARAKQTATPVQREVVTRLEQLIAQMEKQCQGGQCDKPSQQKKQASKRSQSKPSTASKPGPPKPGQGSSAARTSTVQVGSHGANTSEAPTAEELMKAAWGHLPDKVREQMLQGAGDEFLPEYREEIEAYFRRLAEREAEGE